MNTDIKISFIGSGNVATHLAKAFYNLGYSCRQIISKNHENAKILGKKVGAELYSELLTDLDDQSDFYIIAVRDDFIQNILDQLPFCLSDTQILLHTSGTYDENRMQNNAKFYGSFYPLQSFSKESDVDLKKTPILINTNDPEATLRIEFLAKSISQQVHHILHSERQKIHVAAVIANNFTNHLLALAKNFCTKNNLDFNVLWPLVEEGLMKSKKMGPEFAQTGPAIRNDKNTIQKHLEILDSDQNLRSIYRELSVSIQQFYSQS